MWVKTKCGKKCWCGDELRKCGKTCGKILDFQATSAKSSDIVFHDNENFRSKELNIRIKNHNRVVKGGPSY